MNFTPVLALQSNPGYSIWFAILIVIPFGWLWMTQFTQLMLMSENDFPGRYDKMIWGAAFIIIFFFAPFAFWGWKSAYLDLLEKTAATEAPEET